MCEVIFFTILLEVFCASNKTKKLMDFLKYAPIRLGGHFMSSWFDSKDADSRNYSHGASEMSARETTQTLTTPSALSGQ